MPVRVIYAKVRHMKIIFIRHAEPNYNEGCLTPQGRIEAKALADRVAGWDITKIFVSPQQRAKETAQYSLDKLHMEAKTLDFLHEFSYNVTDPTTGRYGVPWDFVPSAWTTDENMFRLEDAFINFPCIKENNEVKAKFDEAINGIDSILADYGYIRKDRYYILSSGEERFLRSTVSDNNEIRNNGKILPPGQKETTLVFFCHLGISCLLLSHILNIPFELLTHGFFMPTTSVTTLVSEERWSNEVYFRVQSWGDCRHLYEAGIPISPAGIFADPFQG